MTKLLMAAYLVVTLLFNATSEGSFPEQVAAKCKGEASFAIPECACTVYNRLQAGWIQDKVLDAYYAKPVEPTEFEVWAVTHVLNEGCDLPIYFMFGKGDFWLPGIKWIEPWCYVEQGNQGVYFYERDYRTRLTVHRAGVCGA